MSHVWMIASLMRTRPAQARQRSTEPTTTPRSLMRGAALLLATATLWAAPADAIDEQTFEQALQEAQTLPRLHSLLINHDDKLVVEEYFNGRRASQRANVKSVSKSIMSALVGIAIAEGKVAGVDQPIGDYATLVDEHTESSKRRITVGNLLSMQAGLETTSFYNYGAWVLSDNWIRFAIRQPLVAEPGTRLTYSTGSTHMLSAILTEATGESTWAFARKRLAQPLGFELAAWQRDPQGIYFGGNNMELTPRQMLSFGRLYLNGGEFDGRRVIPEEWVDLSLTPRVESGREAGRYYGYGWWTKRMAGFESPYAWGYGGQFIMLIPELDLVVVTTSSSQPGGGRRAHIRALYDLIEDKIIKVAAGSIIQPPLAPPAENPAQPSGD